MNNLMSDILELRQQGLTDNLIVEELKSFKGSILANTNTTVTIEDGYNALNVAHMIIEKIRASSI